MGLPHEEYSGGQERARSLTGKPLYGPGISDENLRVIKGKVKGGKEKMALFQGEQFEQRPGREMQHGGLGSRKRF